jgi:hypothetical protein
LTDFLARLFGLEDLANGGILMLRCISVIYFFRKVGSRFSDSVDEIGVVVIAVVQKGRERRNGRTFVERLAVKTPKTRRFGASSYKKPNRYHDKPEMKMPGPNGRWHSLVTSSSRMRFH